jgi:hypothetical protein
LRLSGILALESPVTAYPQARYMRDEVAMCNGGRLLADFVAGTDARPGPAEVLDGYLTTTTDGLWVVWAYKLARQEGDLFVPLTGRSGYPADATATCRRQFGRAGHEAPDPKCTCGFHALSSRKLPRLPVHAGFAVLTVALSGRVLAFEWAGGGVLWRAQRQTVVRVERLTAFDRTGILGSALDDRTAGLAFRGSRRHPGDPDGRPAVVRPATPRDSGPIRLKLPVAAQVLAMCHDDAGWCAETSTLEHSPASLVLA